MMNAAVQVLRGIGAKIQLMGVGIPPPKSFPAESPTVYTDSSWSMYNEILSDPPAKDGNFLWEDGVEVGISAPRDRVAV